MARLTATLMTAILMAVSLLGGCGGGDNAGNGGERGGEEPLPAPNPTSTPVSQPRSPTSGPDWDTVTLFTSGGDFQSRFRLDDGGNCLFDGPGKVTGSDLERVDSLIDAIKEEAHDPLKCTTASTDPNGYRISLTFENRGNAIVYRSRPEVTEECWSGDEGAVRRLLAELLSLQNICNR